jgi:hypothetical protein
MRRTVLTVVLAALLFGFAASSAQASSLIMTSRQAARMRARIAAGTRPWSSAWSSFRPAVSQALAASPRVWTAKAAASGPSSGVQAAYDRDGHYARDAAIGYALTRDAADARKARAFLLAWARGNTPLTYGGMNDAMGGTYLSHGLFGFALAYDLTKGGAVYRAADKATIRAWFARTADGLQTFLNAAAKDWVISHGPDMRSYEWSSPRGFTYSRWERYVGGDEPVLTSIAQLACALEAGDGARVAAMFRSGYVFRVPQIIRAGSAPHNSGDGCGTRPVPQVCIMKPGSADNPGRGGCVDYMSYNERGQAILFELARAAGRATPAMSREIHRSFTYLSRFYGPGAAASPAPHDTVNAAAGLPRMQIARHLFGGNAFAADVRGQTDLVEPQFLGPVLLTQP